MGAGRVIALPFKEGNLTAMGPSKGQRKELGATRLPAPQHLGPRLPHQFLFSIFQSLWKILKTFQIIENTRNIVNIVLNLRICSVKVSKIQVEREGGLGDW